MIFLTDTKEERASQINANSTGNFFSEKMKKKLEKVFKVLVDRKEGGYYIGRTEYDSPEVDNEVLIDAKKNYL
jgi:ribosomal protein S12 methylthiotransferase